MKILHILNHSAPHSDGYCVRSANIVQFQQALGWQPVVLTSPKQEPVPTEEVESIAGVTYYRTLPRKKQSRFLGQVQSMRVMQRRIETIVRKERPDIVHSHSPCTWGWIAARAARRCNVPFVYEVRGIWEDGAVDQGRLKASSLQYWLRQKLETHVSRRAAALVTISAGLEREFQSRCARKVFVVPNGVDLIKFNGTTHAMRPTDDKVVTIGYIGSLYPWEGVEDLVRAAALLRKSLPSIRVRIVGDGESASPVRKLIESMSLGDTVKMLGRIPHDQIAGVYNSTDILVYPRRSSRNTELVTPLKPLEAMAQQKSIVVSDVGGLRELVGENCALVFRAGNASELADKCRELACNADLRDRMGKSAREHVRCHRNWNVLIKIYADVYQHAIASWRT